MRYLPHTERDVAEMLTRAGLKEPDDLFASVPQSCRRSGELDLPEPLTEWELDRHMAGLAEQQAAGSRVFLGAGANPHHSPESVRYLLGRSEFSTAYTPYQPELSQGTLQAIYEYQTLVARLLGLDAANASLYDGATALAEALLMAIRIKRRKKVALSRAVHPAYIEVVRTYFKPSGFEIVELPVGADGRTDICFLEAQEDLAAVAIQSPNFFGVIEDLGLAAAGAHDREALLITGFTEPYAYGVLKSPGALDADIACGEGRGFGVPRSFGGPGLGMFACKMKYIRNIPGRLVGQTEDLDGRRGFVLTLATREQHIRREKAVSNICTNNSLCALAAVMHMASLGSGGLRETARLNHDRAAYLEKGLIGAGFQPVFSGPFFNEFVLRAPDGFQSRWEEMAAKGVVAGLPLGKTHPDLDGAYLFCATEVHTRHDLDELIREVSQ